MQLIVEKTLEYHRVVDPQAEIVTQEIAMQYELLIDQALGLLSEGTPLRRESDKDKEIKKLKSKLAKADSAENNVLK